MDKATMVETEVCLASS